MIPRDTPPLPPEVDARLDGQGAPERQTIESVWRLLDLASLAQPAERPPDAAWDRLVARLDRPRSRRVERPRIARWSSPSRSQPAGLRRTLMMGAAAVLLALAAVALWQRPVTITVPEGVRQTVVLPDGSQVDLNSGTRLRFVRRFEDMPFFPAAERVIHLQGEAYFDVARAERPFVVVTPDVRVEALGTEFNVRTRLEGRNRETTVLLATGRILVSSLEANRQGVALSEAVLTEAGQEVHLRADGGLVETTRRFDNLDVALAWRRDGFAVRNRPLISVLAEIERRYALTIRVHPDLSLADTLTLIYMSPTSPSKILDDICLNQGCRYRITTAGYDLFPPAPASGE